MSERPSIDIDRGPIEYELVSGDPRRLPLVFLHEGLGSIDLWRGVPAEIVDRIGGPTALTYARHGYGQSAPAKMPRPVTYMHHEADAVLPSLLAALDLVAPILVGHSDGASIALLAAARGHASAVVCIAPHVFVEDESIAGIEAALDTFTTTDLATKLGRYHADPEHTFRGWNDVWLNPTFRGWNIEERLPAIDVPVLCVQGTADEYGTLAQIDAIERGVTGRFERLVIEGAGHAPHLEAREQVVAAVAGFVASVSRVA